MLGIKRPDTFGKQERQTAQFRKDIGTASTASKEFSRAYNLIKFKNIQLQMETIITDDNGYRKPSTEMKTRSLSW